VHGLIGATPFTAGAGFPTAIPTLVRSGRGCSNWRHFFVISEDGAARTGADVYT